MQEITVQELKELKDNNADFFLLDVREDVEYMVSNLGGHHIPVEQLENRLQEIEDRKDANVVVMCRSGGRSAKAVALLENHGFKQVSNLTGGIRKWAEEIDPSLPVI